MAYRIIEEEKKEIIKSKLRNYAFFFLFYVLIGSASKDTTISVDFLFLFLLHPLECKFGCQVRAEYYS
jgi:hypothetical protein